MSNICSFRIDRERVLWFTTIVRSRYVCSPVHGRRPDLRARRHGREVRAGSNLRSGAASGHPLAPEAYRRRRRAVGFAAAVAVAVLTLGAQATFTGSGRGPASVAGAGAVVGVRTVRAEAGESLWTIAEEHRGEVAIARYVD